jgi:tyrosine-protein kinase Etk/Wzc
MSAPSRIDPRLHTMLERLRHVSYTRGARVIAFTAPHSDAGTSVVAAMFAQRLHETGLKVLLIDASLGLSPRAPSALWAPGDGQAGQMVASRANAPDQLWISVHPDDAGRFNDPSRLKTMMTHDLAHYDAIIVDCAPAEIGSGSAIEAMTIAAIAGATVLVSKANRTLRAEWAAALRLLSECGAQLAGIVVNDIDAPSFGAEIAREARRFERFLPRLSRGIQSWAQQVALFDAPV